MKGIPFVGENGFYPAWITDRGRWVFQRTLTAVGGLMEGYAEMAAARTPGADQVVVWVPLARASIARVLPSNLHAERQTALTELSRLTMRCYGDECFLQRGSVQWVQSLVSESGVGPESWTLACPSCGGRVGPDLEPVCFPPIVQRWQELNRPSLDNPAASAAFRAAAPVEDLSNWISRNDPSHLELAYLGQQLWQNLAAMYDSLTADTR